MLDRLMEIGDRINGDIFDNCSLPGVVLRDDNAFYTHVSGGEYHWQNATNTAHASIKG